MNIFKRLNNLWKLSGIEIKESWKEINNDNILDNLSDIFINKPQKAQIIKKTNDVEDFLNEI